MPAERAGAVRVAMLAHTYYLRDPRVRREAEALAARGLEVHVICLSEERHAREEREARHAIVNGVQIHRLPISRRRGGPLRYLYEYLSVAVLGGLTLARLHFRARLSVVHVHNMPDILVLAALIPRLGGSKVVLDVHDPMPELYMSWNHRSGSLLVRFLRMQEKISHAFAHRIISVNESMRENLQAKGVLGEKISIINNFPDERLFPLCDAPTSWPRSKGNLVLLYCGTVTEHYDLGLAVRAMARLAGEVPVKLRILGEGNRLREVLELAATLGVADSVEHIGSVPIDRVRDEMRRADAGVSCHRAGIFGDLYFSTKIVEYLTQGLPVLSPRTYTISKYLSEDSLFYFEPGSDAALADSLRFMWHNPAEVLRRLAQARKLLPRLSWQAEKGKLISFYADLTEEASPAARVLSRRQSPTRRS
jgi:glycosyltransferase involved in cell wall biosynthesis